jgi:hypothetical protein
MDNNSMAEKVLQEDVRSQPRSQVENPFGTLDIDPFLGFQYNSGIIISVMPRTREKSNAQHKKCKKTYADESQRKRT